MTLSRRQILAAPLLAKSKAIPKTNVVMFMTGAYGCFDIRTPNIGSTGGRRSPIHARLCCTPVCSPSVVPTSFWVFASVKPTLVGIYPEFGAADCGHLS
jgi:hypothetical protein